jgi:hypothetical protein
MQQHMLLTITITASTGIADRLDHIIKWLVFLTTQMMGTYFGLCCSPNQFLKELNIS